MRPNQYHSYYILCKSGLEFYRRVLLKLMSPFLIVYSPLFTSRSNRLASFSLYFIFIYITILGIDFMFQCM